MKHYSIPIFISHFGCPNSCVFCNQRKINGRETDISTKDIKNIVDNHLKTLPKNSKKQVAFFGGTFTGISIELQREYLEFVYNEYILEKKIDSIRISTRPDCIDEKILEQLKKYSVKTIELGIQSLDAEVLTATDRKYDDGVVEKSCYLIKKYNFELGVQLMVGLPKSNLKKEIETVEKILKLNPNMARIYPTLVICGTELEKMYKRGEYKALSLEEAVERSLEMYKLLELNEIKVIRLGLQPSSDLTADGVILAGPFHPSFRELVEGEIYNRFLREFKKILDKKNKNSDDTLSRKNEKILIEANEKDISKIVGQKSKNKKEFKFDLKIDNNIRLGELKINGILFTRNEVLKGEINYESSSDIYKRI